MKIDVKPGDLFKLEEMVSNPEEYVTAQCIASDLGLFGGIAHEFDLKRDIKKKLRDWAEGNHQIQVKCPYDSDYGSAIPAIVGHNVKIENVYNLVTKTWTFEKPAYKDLVSCLNELRSEMLKSDELFLAIPKIGCGIDGLQWDVVHQLINGIFFDTEISILVVEFRHD